MLVLILVNYWIPALEPSIQEIIYNLAFMMQPRIVAASIIAYLVSQHHDVWAFLKIKEITKGRAFMVKK